MSDHLGSAAEQAAAPAAEDSAGEVPFTPVSEEPAQIPEDECRPGQAPDWWPDDVTGDGTSS